MIGRLFGSFVGGYFTLCGVAALLGAAVLARRAFRLARGHRAEGIIVGYAERMRERRTSRIHYMPVVRFVAGASGEQVVQSRTGTIRPERLPVGSSVPVLYDPDNPSFAEIAGGGRLWMAPLGLAALAAGAMMAAWKAGG